MGYTIVLVGNSHPKTCEVMLTSNLYLVINEHLNKLEELGTLYISLGKRFPHIF